MRKKNNRKAYKILITLLTFFSDMVTRNTAPNWVYQLSRWIQRTGSSAASTAIT